MDARGDVSAFLIDSRRSMVRGRRLFVLLYAASGAAALVYEVAWTRLLTLQLGHTVASASTVLAAFMGGLASVPGWRRGCAFAAFARTRRSRSSLRSPRCCCRLRLAATAPILAWAYADGTAPVTFTLVRVAISLALLGVPTAAMGATFPIAADCAASFGDRTPVDSALLYTANTAGAACGAIAAGFWLIPTLGLRGTTWVGVALNLVAAGGAWWLSTQPATGPRDVSKPAPAPGRAPARKNPSRPSRSAQGSKPEPSSSPAPGLACAASAISGFAALIYEVAWTRLLALVIGPTTYAFATMAAAFISGLAIGSALGTRLARRVARPAVWLAAMLVASAVAASGAAWFAATRHAADRRRAGRRSGRRRSPRSSFTQAFGIRVCCCCR